MLAVYADVFFRSKVVAVAEAYKADVKVLQSILDLEKFVPPVDTVLVDLNKLVRGEEEVFVELPLDRIIGFCGHTQTALIEWGKTFCDEVWPKSRVDTELPRLLSRGPA